MNYSIKANDPISKQIRSLGISSWEELLSYVRQLAYGRNRNRKDFSLVLKEQKGTCSSKHAFLKKVADLNKIPSVKLILGMYKMNASNTPKIGNILVEEGFDYLPEAHCYLVVESKRMDNTTDRSNFDLLADSILLEKEIEAEDVNEFKVTFHQKYLKEWMKEEAILRPFDDIWKIRERCIASLAVKDKTWN